ncbi:MAG: Crp/Fnr family transcriptional regulator [Fusobacteriaceae bacterium]
MTKISKYIDFFNLNDILVKDIVEKLFIKNYKKDEYILESNNGANSIYFIVDGTVEISCILDNGNQVCLNVLKPLEIFGDIEFINDEEVLFDVIAKTDVTLILLPFSVARDSLNNNIHFWKFLAIEGNKKLLNTNRAIFYKSTLKAKDIFIKYLEDNNGYITFKSLDELSSRLNISYRNLTRIISYYNKKNLISKDRNSITYFK